VEAAPVDRLIWHCSAASDVLINGASALLEQTPDDQADCNQDQQVNRTRDNVKAEPEHGPDCQQQQAKRYEWMHMNFRVSGCARTRGGVAPQPDVIQEAFRPSGPDHRGVPVRNERWRFHDAAMVEESVARRARGTRRQVATQPHVVVSRPNYVANRTESQLWAVDLPDGTPRLLTPGRTSVSSPKWAPGGRGLALLSPDSTGRNQLWLLAGEGGEARQVSTHPTAVEYFGWRPDGAAFALAAADEEPRKEGEARFITTFEVDAQDLFFCAARSVCNTSGPCLTIAALRSSKG